MQSVFSSARFALCIIRTTLWLLDAVAVGDCHSALAYVHCMLFLLHSLFLPPSTFQRM